MYIYIIYSFIYIYIYRERERERERERKRERVNYICPKTCYGRKWTLIPSHISFFSKNKHFRFR